MIDIVDTFGFMPVARGMNREKKRKMGTVLSLHLKSLNAGLMNNEQQQLQ